MVNTRNGAESSRATIETTTPVLQAANEEVPITRAEIQGMMEALLAQQREDMRQILEQNATRVVLLGLKLWFRLSVYSRWRVYSHIIYSHIYSAQWN